MTTTRTFRVLLLALAAGLCLSNASFSQTCYTNSGCQDYSNFGFSSTGASTLEYDNYVSAFHQTVVRDLDGSLKIWGELTKANGADSWLVPTTINAGNYPGLTGTPLKVAIGSYGTGRAQFLLLTSDNKLWAWGTEDFMISNSLTTSTSFQQLSIGLPAGVTASTVKMLFGTTYAVVLTTCGGDVYVLSGNGDMRGAGGTGSGTAWSHVQKQSGGFLSGIVAARASMGGVIALDTAGGLWVWGQSWDGVNTTSLSYDRAIPLAAPAGATDAIKMIGTTHTTNGYDVSYYVLYENGRLYSMGHNSMGQLGNWNTTSQPNWVQPTYSAGGTPMNDIKWISPNEHDFGYAAINVINSSKVVYSWGEESGNMIGRGSNNSGPSAVNPGQPTNFQSGYSNSNIIAVESGGHTTMVLRECTSTFGYVGHRTEGSMGDNVADGGYDAVYHFNTNAVQVCGGETVNASLNAAVNGPYCIGNTLQLLGTPAGGTYAIDVAGSTATATLSGTTLTFTGEGTLRVNYTVNDGSSCGTVTVVKVFAVEDCGSRVTIPGTIWNDANGDAVIGSGETGMANGLWVNLVDPNGNVIASAKVNTNGTYTFQVGTGYLATSGNYSITITNTDKEVGDRLTAADVPTGGYGYTGVNRGTTGIDNTNRTGQLNIGNLSGVAGGTTTSP
ncbi:hypothetical protein [Niabella hibiscisoli]|uniref:hypothetical protein n=1 Tax=Niabella hibiscisoli TaxID=1825928 RepID=UPI001F0F8951|nr:hypothetical protein [Niabella hibiscisoli]MCH5720380.1 hypothetical protein [Niabella hibiscisoli]